MNFVVKLLASLLAFLATPVSQGNAVSPEKERFCTAVHVTSTSGNLKATHGNMLLLLPRPR